jgi:hypothetical protein
MKKTVVKIGLLLVTGLLFLSLWSLEIPEFATLTDDVSNDFILRTSVDEIASPAVKSREPEAQCEEIPRTEHLEYTISTPTFIVAPRITNDLLRLFCIQRE